MVFPIAERLLDYETPARWASAVLAEPLALLNDHAHLERKAASNALELLGRWPEPEAPPGWTAAFALLARDEAAHLQTVARALEQRGGRLSRTHANPYAQALRALVRRGEGNAELADRLLVSALIEARSCERFALLARQEAEPELARLYASLEASERGHAAAFLRLAELAGQGGELPARWDELRAAEARIIQAQSPGPRLHSGLAPSPNRE